MQMVTDPRFDPEPTYTEAPPREKSGCSSCMTGCGIVGLIVVILLAILAFWLWRNWRDLFAKGTTAAISQMVESTGLPEAEKQKIMVQVERLSGAIRDGRLTAERSALLMQQIIESPLVMTLGVSAIEKKYIENSGLNDEEKAESRQTLNRFMRGVIDEKIPQRSIDDALSHVAVRQPNDVWQLRENVSDDELREFLSTAKAAADRAEIPDQEETVDPSLELKRIIDNALQPEPPLAVPPEAPPEALPEAPPDP